METTYRLKASEIDGSFVASIKRLFKSKTVEVTITDTFDDETEFLLSHPNNRKKLLTAIEDVKQNKNLVRFTAKEFEKFSDRLMKK